ncbi:hypothetical protein RE428_28460 [Marinobacter nanhaiticus D15-8W]|nr:hypothetical protein RE428_28460 [Marinobacter nanhaiticus D15-8W]
MFLVSVQSGVNTMHKGATLAQAVGVKNEKRRPEGGVDSDSRLTGKPNKINSRLYHLQPD